MMPDAKSVLFLGSLLQVIYARELKIGLLIENVQTTQGITTLDGAETQGFENSSNLIVKEISNILVNTTTVCDMIHDGAVGVISYTSCHDAAFVHWFSKQYDIPFIMIINQTCNFLKDTSHIHLHPVCAETNGAIASITRTLVLTNVTVFHDGLSAFCVRDLIQQLSEMSVRSKTISVDSYESIRKHREVFKRDKACYVILITSNDRLRQYLQTAKEDGFLASNIFWILSSNELDTLNIETDDSSIHGANILIVRPSIPAVSEKGYNCGNSDISISSTAIQDAINLYQHTIEELEKNGEPLVFRSSCINKTTDSNGSHVNDILHKSQHGDQRLKNNLFSNQHGVFETYHLCSTTSSKRELQHVGTWSRKQGLKADYDLFQNARVNFKNATLTVVTRMALPFDVKIEHENGGFSYTGFCFDILDELARSFNFTYNVIEPPDGLYGAPTDNGSWNGMVGMVMSGKANMSIAPFTITSLREAVIDFSTPIMEDGVGIIMKKPTSDTNNMFHMFLPFSPAVWGSLAAAIVTVGFVLFVINRNSPYSARTKGKRLNEVSITNEESFLGCLWIIYAAFFEEGGPPFPRAVSGRCVLGVWWIFTIVLLSSYTANLAAVLTVTITKKPIDSLKDLADNRQIKPLVKAGTSLHSLFKNSKSEVYQDVWENMEDMPYVKTAEESLELVKTGKYAFMTDVSQLQYAMLKDCKAYEIADEVFNRAGLGFVFPEEAPYIEAFNYQIMRMHEAGLIERWRRYWWPQASHCSLTDHLGSANALGLTSLAGLFFVYASTVGISIFGLFIETWWKRRNLTDAKESTL